MGQPRGLIAPMGGASQAVEGQGKDRHSVAAPPSPVFRSPRRQLALARRAKRRRGVRRSDQGRRLWSRRARSDAESGRRGMPRLFRRDLGRGRRADEIGRASCRERGCQYVSISGGAVSLKKKKKNKKTTHKH